MIVKNRKYVYPFINGLAYNEAIIRIFDKVDVRDIIDLKVVPFTKQNVEVEVLKFSTLDLCAAFPERKRSTLK